MHHARVSGACESCAAGRCFRHGEGVSYAAHAQYLTSIGLEPERGADGAWRGYVAGKEDPLEDEAHPFAAAQMAAVADVLEDIA